MEFHVEGDEQSGHGLLQGVRLGWGFAGRKCRGGKGGAGMWVGGQSGGGAELVKGRRGEVPPLADGGLGRRRRLFALELTLFCCCEGRRDEGIDVGFVEGDETGSSVVSVQQSTTSNPIPTGRWRLPNLIQQQCIESCGI